jgi:uncharacterized membrane protein
MRNSAVAVSLAVIGILVSFVIVARETELNSLNYSIPTNVQDNIRRGS